MLLPSDDAPHSFLTPPAKLPTFHSLGLGTQQSLSGPLFPRKKETLQKKTCHEAHAQTHETSWLLHQRLAVLAVQSSAW